MHRIDAPGFASGNLFTEGNPALGVPATEISDDWANDVQEELCTVIENAGIVLAKGTQNQLYNAILGMIGLGGSQIKLDPLANITANQVITGLVFNKATFKAAIMIYDCHRQTDSSNEQEVGILFATHDSKDDLWRVSKLITALDDAGLTFNITSAGQMRVSTDDLVGTNYAAQIRVTGIFKFNQ